ncbi:MAG: aminopeptidase P family N-terminal domain-containing protein [Erysipelotrichaceae bacterium]|nr:aminopeptidase P family N-terminal domain-containing protein [Erysipelotrichaceae bacterium]
MDKYISKIQGLMKSHNIDIYYLTTSDDHLSEYIPEHYRLIKFLTGFSGSLAKMLITQDKAYLWVDGRYHKQADQEVTSKLIEVMKEGKNGVKSIQEFLADYHHQTLAFDGKLTSYKFISEFCETMNLVSIDLVSELYEDRPALIKEPIFELDLKYTGVSREAKIKAIKNIYQDNTLIVGNLEEIAYLLNLRGKDIKHTPVFRSFVIYTDNNLYLFIDYEKISPELNDKLRNDNIILKEYDEYYRFLNTLTKQNIFIDLSKINYETIDNLHKSNHIHDEASALNMLKAIKNDVEIEGMKKAHLYDAVSLIRLYMWLDKIDLTTINELDVAKKLNSLRLEYKAFDLSFSSIIAYNENAAMMHYNPENQIPKQLDNQGILLMDSGGHYLEGTTDITRTIALGPISDEIKKYYTLTLRSMFNLADVKFIKCMNGQQLDILARMYLWKEGVDYRCGTGHGVGQTLSVHEAPPSIRFRDTIGGSEKIPFKKGMVVSDEPGVYFEGKYGIRLENLLYCDDYLSNEYGDFLCFKHLTFVPFDHKLIDLKYLDDETLKLLNEYHQACFDKVSPLLENEEEINYLRNITRSIKR